MNIAKYFLFSLLLIFFSSQAVNCKIIKYAYVKYNKVNIRSCPSKRCNIIGKVKRNVRLNILGYKSRFYKINLDGVLGWIYSGALTKPIKKNIPDYKVTFEFNNLNKNAQEKILEFKQYLNFDFYKREVKVAFSYNPEFNIGRIFLKTEFNLQYYNTHKDSSVKPNQLDMYPFLEFANAFKIFLNKLLFQYQSLEEFLSKFKLNLILKKSDSNFIIMEFYKKGKLFQCKPYIFLKKQGYNLIKIPTEDKEILEKSYIFTLGVPTFYDGTKTTYSLVYEFFNIPY